MGIPNSEEDGRVVFEGTVYQPSESGSVVLVRDANSGILTFLHKSSGPVLISGEARSEVLNRVAKLGNHDFHES